MTVTLQVIVTLKSRAVEPHLGQGDLVRRRVRWLRKGDSAQPAIDARDFGFVHAPHDSPIRVERPGIRRRADKSAIPVERSQEAARGVQNLLDLEFLNTVVRRFQLE